MSHHVGAPRPDDKKDPAFNGRRWARCPDLPCVRVSRLGGPPAMNTPLRLLAALVLLDCLPLTANAEMIASGVWKWNALEAQPNAIGEERMLFAGEGADVSELTLTAVTLAPGKSAGMSTNAEREEMVVVKSGQLSASIGETSKLLGPGSVAVALAGDAHEWRNTGTDPVTYFVLQFKSRRGFTAELADKRGESVLIDQHDVAFQANPRGGYRGFFNRSTGSLELFELHETTLVAGVQNHAVHTHGAEEMVIMLEGYVDLQINGVSHFGKPGDVFFIHTNDPHTLFTHGETKSRYFAFQWR